jgi:two-component system, NtrC family, sensor kinase
MFNDSPFRSLSLKARLILSYLVILGIGGLATSIVGSYIVSTTIQMQVLRAVDNNLATARLMYDQQLDELKRTVELTASGTTVVQYLAAGDRASLLAYLQRIRDSSGYDFLTLVDEEGQVILRVSNPGRAGDQAAPISVVRAARSGKVAAATEIIAAEDLESEHPLLRERARTRLVETPRSKPFDRREETSGMVMIAAAPVYGRAGAPPGVLYAGVLLNGNFTLVDRVSNLLLRDDRFQNGEIGSVTIFQDNFRISTNVRMSDGERALGTRAAPPVEEQVMGRGESWSGPAFVVNEWYLSGYAPIRNFEGKVIGAVFTGLLESTYTSTRNNVIMSFFAVAMVGFICIIGITYYMIRNITRPVGEMVAATQNIAAGRFDQEIQSESHGEIAQLAASFNTMLASLREMKADLEEWGRTLEVKVHQRSEELAAMQARMAQSERLASLGLLAAGVAHEINNPLGAILSLTALTLEDTPPSDPNRENLVEVLNQSQRCRGIVKGLLDFSRQSKGNMEALDMNALVNDTLSLIGKQAQFFNIRIVKDLDPDLPAVTGDRSQFQQVFMNLLINAVQAMNEKGVVSIDTRSGPGEHVEVRISDTGRGIPPDQIDLIFDPFFSTKESGHGTGLGLSIAYGIVSNHRGTISVESEVDKGTTFTIRLPAANPVPRESQA